MTSTSFYASIPVLALWHIKFGPKFDDEEELKMDAVIHIVSFPNSRVKDFNVNRVISKSHIERFFRPLRDSSGEYLKNTGSLGSLLVREILRLPGVTTVTIQPYTIGIEISPAHDWTSIEGTIVNLLKRKVFPSVDLKSTIKVSSSYLGN